MDIIIILAIFNSDDCTSNNVQVKDLESAASPVSHKNQLLGLIQLPPFVLLVRLIPIFIHLRIAVEPLHFKNIWLYIDVHHSLSNTVSWFVNNQIKASP